MKKPDARRARITGLSAAGSGIRVNPQQRRQAALQLRGQPTSLTGCKALKTKLGPEQYLSRR
jgi:hypothetical protein